MTDINTKPLEEPVFGTVQFVHPDDAHRDTDFKYTASRTGVIMYARNQHSNPAYSAPQVIAHINGSMCIVPLDAVLDATNFDDYLVAWLIDNDYRPARVRHGKAEPGIAYLDPKTMSYTTAPTAAHLAQWPETNW